MVKMYWLEIAKPNGELTIYEMMTASQIMFLRNIAVTAGYPVRSGQHGKDEYQALTQEDIEEIFAEKA
jgi:hypothetical protein